MLISYQIRAARAALDWTASKLADKAGVGLRTVMRIEAEDGVPQTTTGTLIKIQSALEAAGIEFIGSPDDAPGIRIHRRKD
ncbi:helix-turn-helix transcriptional regulator [Porphyrobacter sp. LM 6]|jgi:transcriptional regulator with XRE-family HTH domain|uniref:helix-turn-helix transcriptional regulator n=1 Tax=Porphyrobacter sp. LM 6 TaxID=1896196 RepID=UPI0008462AF9|nr:helix-turn-helix domain-containing protein [Porphyrobacter sp. LM 6]AOL93015.1 helix-turn-helix protein [Porphyrobacter sp. LM 6]